MRILFAGGGTAGHVNPAVAVANYIREKEPDSEFLFVGTKEGMESTLVPRQGYEIKFIKIHGFRRSLSLSNLKTLGEILSSVKNAKKIIKEFKPEAVVGTGGYVSGPVLLAAAMLKIPTLIHEANAYPGVTVRLLSKFVDVVALGMGDAKMFLKGCKNIEVTGNPVRPSILGYDKKTAKEKLGLDERPTILIYGGSLGAEKINEVAVDFICAVKDQRKYQIIMSTGKNNNYNKVIKNLKDKGVILEDYPEIRVSEYIYDMDLCLNAADLIVARSGGSVSEMTAIGKASILIPSPYVSGNHQEYNARTIERAGGAEVICERDLDFKTLKSAVDKILEDKNVLERMEKASYKVGIKDATDKIHNILKNLKNSKGK